MLCYATDKQCCAEGGQLRGGKVQEEACLDKSRVNGRQVALYSREVASIDSMSRLHNATLLCLAEDFSEVHPRNDPRLDGVRQHLARTHRGQLVHIPCTHKSTLVTMQADVVKLAELSMVFWHQKLCWKSCQRKKKPYWRYACAKC